MKTLISNRVCALVLSSISLLWAGTANAAHPASVTGNWNATGNQTLGILSIVQAAGITACRRITGSIFFATNAIEGVYCPATGRIVFVRKLSTGVPFQLYEGHVSQDGIIDRIGGSFKIWNATGGAVTTDGPDYNFSATK
jgi:hypothetical protein